MANRRAKEIVEAAEAEGYSHKDIAEICNVSIGTVSRWKNVGRARSNVIALLEEKLNSAKETAPKFINEATLEDLAERARELGFQATFTDIRK